MQGTVGSQSLHAREMHEFNLVVLPGCVVYISAHEFSWCCSLHHHPCAKNMPSIGP